MKFRGLIYTAMFGALALLLLSCSAPKPDENPETLIAVATNFRAAFDALEIEFETATDFNITQVNGATGHLYTQIKQGAPYHAFLAADTARPALLYSQGLSSEPVTYAQGVLVLWSAKPFTEAAAEQVLRGQDYRSLAIANPKLAPYGSAAMEVVSALELETGAIVSGENAGQAFALAATGNADVALIAKADSLRAEGYSLEIDTALYEPILQDAVLLKNGEANDAAKAFLAYLQSPQARAIIKAQGYLLPEPSES